MRGVEGKLTGLKPSQVRALERLYRRKTRADLAVSPELGASIAALSSEIGRQIGVILDRRGRVVYVIVGDKNEIVIPELSRVRTFSGRLKGLRLIHTHLNAEPLSRDDLNDLVMLRLDMIMAITVSDEGRPDICHIGYLNIGVNAKKPWKVEAPKIFSGIDFRFDELIAALDAEFAKTDSRKETTGELSAILVHISEQTQKDSQASVDELAELARTEKVDTIDTLTYHGLQNPKNLVGGGRLKEIIIRATTQKADLILFDQELSAAQARYIGSVTDIPLLDRTQLILNIFARRAHTADGKLRVELARLDYLLPRLGAKDDALSRIRGGIGMRGPGETTMEVSRRRIKERMRMIRAKLAKAGQGREIRRRRRNRSNIPQVAVVGYTNAGKSTLLNALTKSAALVEDKLFATLDPMSRRVRFPKEHEVVFSDTVGFIRDLPEGLLGAFRSTLEELKDADLLLHLIDVSAVEFESAKNTVDKILETLDLDDIPLLVVLNKIDAANKDIVKNASRRYKAVAISATLGTGLDLLVDEIVEKLDSITALR